MQSNRWFVRASRPHARLRLFCFSYAGGVANAFVPWQQALEAADIEVCAIQLPGRADRLQETPFTSMGPLVSAVNDALSGLRPGLPFAFFGHSMGGLVAFELARHRAAHHLPAPERLFVSGCDAPRDRSTRRLHELPDDALLEALRDYNGAPPAVLAHRELMELMLPTIRADFAVVGDYRYLARPLLNIPITVLGGTNDHHVATHQLEHWKNETTGPVDVQLFDGDHFFIDSNRGAVLASLRDTLDPAACTAQASQS